MANKMKLKDRLAQRRINLEKEFQGLAAQEQQLLEAINRNRTRRAEITGAVNVIDDELKKCPNTIEVTKEEAKALCKKCDEEKAQRVIDKFDPKKDKVNL